MLLRRSRINMSVREHDQFGTCFAGDNQTQIAYCGRSLVYARERQQSEELHSYTGACF